MLLSETYGVCNGEELPSPAQGQPMSRALQTEDASFQAGVGGESPQVCSPLILSCPGLGQLLEESDPYWGEVVSLQVVMGTLIGKECVYA